MSYASYILTDIVSWRIKQVEGMKTVVDNVLRMIDHGISRRVVCYLLMSLHYQCDQIKNDIASLGLRIATYVGTRAVSRIFQIDTSKRTVYVLYSKNYIPYQSYTRAINVLDHEAYAVYTRWMEFSDQLKDAFGTVIEKVEEVIRYIESRMDEVCKE